MIALLLLVGLNVLIAWLNAYAAGTVWHEAKLAGGIERLTAWGGAVMSAIGFSMPILLLVTAGGMSWLAAHPELGVEHVKFAKAVTSVWYLLVIVPVIGIGLLFTLLSWQEAIKTRHPIALLEAGWNTYATTKNTLSAIDEVPKAFGAIGEAFGDAGDGEGVVGLMLVCVVVAVATALAGGALVTTWLIGRYSRREARFEALAASR